VREGDDADEDAPQRHRAGEDADAGKRVRERPGDDAEDAERRQRAGDEGVSACVSEFAERFGDPRGTAPVPAHTLLQTGPLRPDYRAGIDGLYYVGADTRPGIGMPMCLVSGEHVTNAMPEDAPFGARTARLRGRVAPPLAGV
jgi:phytoene dehydrogenase-like protein